MDVPKALEISSLDLAAMDRLASAMLRELPSHLIVGLVGTLGAGKTTFVQAIAKAAGIDTADVTSPTFTLLHTHRGARTLHHLDAYRLADEDEFLDLGVEELFEDSTAWTLIEWADRMRSVMPDETLWVELRPVEQEKRQLHLFTQHGPTASALARLAAEF